VLNIN